MALGQVIQPLPILALAVIQHWHGAGDYRTRHIWQDTSNRPRLPSPAPKGNPSKPTTSNRPAIKFSLCAWRVGT